MSSSLLDLDNHNVTSTILVVDDEAITRSILQKVLTESGYKVICAKNGKHAIGLLEEHDVDLILMDLVMPELDGFETCRRVRSLAKGRTLPILVLTGLNDVNAVSQAFEAGATDFVTKPLSFPLISHRVRYALRNCYTMNALKDSEYRLSRTQLIAKISYWNLDLENLELILFTYSSDLLEISLSNRIPLEEFFNFVHEDYRETLSYLFRDCIKNRVGFSSEFRSAPQIGEKKFYAINAECSESSDKYSMVSGILQDITDRKKAEDLIVHQTFYDSVTDLPNERLLKKRVNALIRKGGKWVAERSLIFVRIERFEKYTQTLGPSGSNSLLKILAVRLKSDKRRGMFVCRYANNVFAFLLDGLKRGDEGKNIIESIKDLFTQKIEVNGAEICLHVNIGITHLDDNGSDDAEDVIKHADIAMHNSQFAGENQYRFYVHTMDKKVIETLQFEQDLRAAVGKNEFYVVYQPQIDVHTGHVAGVEALVRWFHPKRGVVPPLDFIPIAEEIGLIVAIGEFVLETACAQLAQWHRQGLSQLRMGVNLSTKQFQSDRLIPCIQENLKVNNIPASCFDVEITESVAINDLEGSIALLNEIRSHGVKVSMDDFGTGFSSLASLQRLPLDTLKIDRAFVKDIGPNGENGAFAKMIAAMAKSLGMYVIAEGAEHEYQKDYLKICNVDEIQGYYYCPPLTPEKLDEYLIKHARAQKTVCEVE